MKKIILSLFLWGLSAGVASAASTSAHLFDSSSTLSSVINQALGIFSTIVPVIVGAAVVVFIYGVFTFILKSSAGDADGRKEGINFMIFGIIGIAVMVSLWGLVAFVTNTIGTSTVIPQFKTSSQEISTESVV